MTTTIIDQMVNRFLCWQLPQDFCPDHLISFDSGKAKNYGWPIGTHLLTATQARAMIEHMLDGVMPSNEMLKTAEEFERLRTRIEELRGALKSASGWLADLDDMEHALECIEMAGDMEPPTIPITQIDRVIGGDD